MDDRIPGEQFLRENGFLFIHPVGKSMLPLFRGGLETVALAPPDDIRVGDVVWYRRTDGSDVLHRVLRAEGDVLDLCGDNQIQIERGVSCSKRCASSGKFDGGIMLQCETTQRQLMALLRAYLTGQPTEAARFRTADWDALWREAKLQTVSGFAYAAAQRLPMDCRPDETRRRQWQRETMKAYLHFAALFAAQSRFCSVLEDAGIPVCIWKGIAAAAAYPEPELRTMGDVDALVPAEDMQTARSALLRAGYEPEKGKPHEDAMHWGVQKDGVIFEVHRSVTNSAALPEGFLPLDGQQTVQTIYGSFTALNATTHACAMLRHFVSSGFGLQQLYDWAFWLKNMPVDAQKVHALACAAGAERFLYAVTRVCADSFGLQTDYGWEAQMDGSVSERILEDILLGGNWGLKEGDRTYSLVFTATEGRAAQGRGAQIAGKLDRLAEELCPWTRRHRAVRALLWGPVCVQFAWRVLAGKRRVPHLVQAQAIAARRSRMFAELGLTTAQKQE